MRRIVAVILWAWIPLCWQPLWGQAPGVRVQPGHEEQQKTPLATDHSNDDQRGTKNSPLVVDTTGHQNSPAETAKAKADEERTNYINTWTLRFTGASAVFTGILMFAGIGGVLLAIRTLNGIEAQGGLMERQTKVLEGQAAALINSDRAWVLISKVWGPAIGPPVMGQTNQFLFDLTNSGKTVARLGRYRTKFRLIGRNERLPDIPDYEIDPKLFGDIPESPIHCQVMAPGQPETISAPCWEVQIGPGIFESLKKREIVLYFYASLEYFDFADKKRELQFCYRYTPEDELAKARWIIDGPKEYNKHT
jgi:hypothetical protein